MRVNAFDVILLLVFIIVFVTSAVCILITNFNISNKKNSNDPDLVLANKYSFYATLASWLIIGLVIVVAIIAAFSGGLVAVSRFVTAHPVFVNIASMFILSILILGTGVLALLSAVYIRRSSEYNTYTNIRSAYEYAIIAAALGVGTVGLMIIFFIVRTVLSVKRQQRIQRGAERLAILEKQGLIS